MRLVRERHLTSTPAVSSRRRLMVVERGASLSCRDDAADFDETTAITQLSGESPDDLSERVLTRIALAQRSGQRFDSALLIVSESGAPSARRAVALGLATPGPATACLTELVILAPAQASSELRAALLELTDELVFGAERSLPVRLCFAAGREEELRSGTFWCIPERDSGT